jgi:hypothetical protein
LSSETPGEEDAKRLPSKSMSEALGAFVSGTPIEERCEASLSDVDERSS